jgi:predicted lipoprotein with Yx(FWY)xxD motif
MRWVLLLPVMLAGCFAGCSSFGGSSLPVRFESDREVARLVDPNRMSLYTYDRDRRRSGLSLCNGACAEEWPPLIAPVDAKPSSDFHFITREDGRRQWTHKDRPLYRFAGDRVPGDVRGHGVANLWRLAQ